MTAFADRYPSQVIFQMLGIPAELHHRCQEWVADLNFIFSWSAAARLPQIEAALDRLHPLIDELVTQRRRQPGDDLISALILAEDAGDTLTDDELRYMVSVLLFASQDTTRNQFGLAMVTFSRHLDQWALLADCPDLGARASEEVARVNPTVPSVFRVAAQDLTYGDLHIPTGTSVTILVAAAHTDPRAFGPQGDRFDITATRARQLSFGGGVHACLGMGLARLELAVGLPILAQRLGPIRLTSEPTHLPPATIHGPISLALSFTGPDHVDSPSTQRD